MIRLGWRRYGALYVVIMIASWQCTRDPSSTPYKDGVPPNVLARIAHDTGLVFQPGSRVLKFYEPDGIVDPTWVAKVLVPVSSFEEIGKMASSYPEVTSRVTGALSDSTEWWSPVHPEMSKRYEVREQVYVRVILAREGREHVVYIDYAVF